MKLARKILLTAMLLAAPVVAFAQSSEGWSALARPGTHALMRHATAPGVGDPDNFRLGDCATQRNLSDTGRAEAKAAGAAIRDRGIRINLVLTSQWCRTQETARLLDLGAVREEPALNSFFEDRSTRADQSLAVIAHLKSLRPDDKAILVTHQVNITALVGGGVSSGEIVVVSLDADGKIVLEGRIKP